MKSHLTKLGIIVALVVMLGPTWCRADTVFRPLMTIGSEGTGPGQFTNTDAGAYDPKLHRVYASDRVGHVNIFDENGTWLTWWGEAVGTLDKDAGIFVDDSSFVYDVDSDHHQLVKYTSDGQLIWAKGSNVLYYPFDGAFNPTNRLICISDQGHHRLVVFNTDGEALYSIGDGGDSDPYGIGIDQSSGEFWVVYHNSANNDYLRKYSPAGAVLGQYGSYGTGDLQFRFPYKVAVNSQHQAFVTDRNNYRVQVLNRDGTFNSKWGNSSMFNPPSAIVLVGDCHAWVSSHYGGYWTIFGGGATPARQESWGAIKARYDH